MSQKPISIYGGECKGQMFCFGKAVLYTASSPCSSESDYHCGVWVGDGSWVHSHACSTTPVWLPHLQLRRAQFEGQTPRAYGPTPTHLVEMCWHMCSIFIGACPPVVRAALWCSRLCKRRWGGMICEEWAQMMWFHGPR